MLTSSQREFVKDVFSSYEKVKERLAIRLCTQDDSLVEARKMVSLDLPEGLTETFVVLFPEFDFHVPVRKEYLSAWGVDKAAVAEDAEKQAEALEPVLVETMQMASIICIGADPKEYSLLEGKEAEDETLYVLSDREKKPYSASLICRPEVMRQVGEAMKNDFFVIPSSVHEVLIYHGSLGAEYLKGMVKEVNSGMMDEDIFSWHVFRYIREEGKLVIAA